VDGHPQWSARGKSERGSSQKQAQPAVASSFAHSSIITTYYQAPDVNVYTRLGSSTLDPSGTL